MILVTTRDDRVANVSESKKPHHPLSFMDKEESWQLFRNEVFRSKKCPLELEPIGRSIAQSCNGLPLAIKTVAGIVARRDRSNDAWEEIKNMLPYWSVAEDKEGKKMMEILKFSYDDLPNNMKPCFLYLGVFPEDDEILVTDLIHLWIAERFIKPIQTGRSKAPPPKPEDIGEEYLKELVDRNLVQVASRRSDGKGVKTCQIHDLIRELCILVSNDNPDNSNNARRLSFARDIGSYACSATCNQSNTCSLFVYGDSKGWPYHIPQDCQVNALYVKGFSRDLTDEMIAEYLERLKSLRFLKMGIAASDLLKVQSLQTLHVLFPLEHKEISIHEGFKQLRHFRFKSEVHFLVDEQEVKDKMQNLQTLCYVSVDSRLNFLLQNGYFPNLITLGLVIHESQVDPVEENLRGLHHLSNLLKLKLQFFTFERVPLDNIAFPSNLTKITLYWLLDLKYEDMNALGRIPSLRILKLCEVELDCTNRILNCGSPGSFPQLQVFIMLYVRVTYLTLEDGVMPCLRGAVFHKCPGLKLKHLPERMHSLGCNLKFSGVSVDNLD